MSNMLTGAIIARDEERTIAETIKSLAFCDEIIVINDRSVDNTVKIAEKLGAHIFNKSLDGNFSTLRNFALEKAKGDWILFIDADEEVSPELAKEITKSINNDDCAGYFIKRIDTWWGREIRHGEAGNIKLLRLIKKGMGTWTGKVHEVLETHGETGTLNAYLFHKPHQTIADFLHHINIYSSIRAEELKEQGVKGTISQVMIYPSAKFILNYFIRMGFRDGPAGFVYAFMMSFHSFLVRAKLYQLQDK